MAYLTSHANIKAPPPNSQNVLSHSEDPPPPASIHFTPHKWRMSGNNYHQLLTDPDVSTLDPNTPIRSLIEPNQRTLGQILHKRLLPNLAGLANSSRIAGA